MKTHSASFAGLSALTAVAALTAAGLARSASGPAAPTDIKASAGPTGQVVLIWRDNSDSEMGFRVDRDPPFDEGSVIVPADTTSFLDQPGKGAFTYRISAIGSEADSPVASSRLLQVRRGVPGPHGPATRRMNRDGGGRLESSTPGQAPGSVTAGGGSSQTLTAPAAPSGLRATAGSGNVRLSWRDQSDNEFFFEGQRETSPDGQAWASTSEFTTVMNTTTYQDPIEPGLYRYRVRAGAIGGHSGYTDWVIVSAGAGSTTPAATPPEAPSGIAVSDIGGGRAMVTWTDVSNNEDGFRIEREPAFSSGTVSVSANTAAYIDQCGNGNFSYKVRSYNTTGNSAFTAWAAVNVTSAAGGPSGGTGGPTGGTGGTTGGTGGTTGGTGGGTVGGTGGGTGPTPLASFGSATCAGTATYGAVGLDGWTVLAPNTGSRVIYVSSSMGSDSNSGTSESSPKRTIAAGVGLLRDGYPDWLVLKAGDTFNEAFPGWNLRGRSANEMLVVSSYGPGPRPVLKTGTANSGISAFAAVAHVALMDLHFIADGYDGTNATPVAIAMIGGASDILIENCKVERYLTGMVVQWVGNAGQPSNIRLRRNVIVDCYRVGLDIHTAGLYLDGINGLLLEENVIDHNGWREDIGNAVPTMFRRNVYIQSNCVNVSTRGNIIARSASDGMQQRSGGLCENNLFLKNTTNLTFSHGGIIRNNIMLDSRDLDAASPSGGGINVDYAQGVEVTGNVLAHRSTAATWNLGGIGVTHNSSGVTIRRNIIYNWWNAGAPEAQAIDVQAGTTAVVENNDFQMPNGVFVVKYTGSATFANNRYYSSNSTPFWTMAGYHTLAQWRTLSGDSSSVMSNVPYPDPGRTVGTYMQTLSMPGNLDAFLAEARKQSRDNWRPAYTADAVAAYIRAGFAGGPLPTP